MPCNDTEFYNPIITCSIVPQRHAIYKRKQHIDPSTPIFTPVCQEHDIVN